MDEFEQEYLFKNNVESRAEKVHEELGSIIDTHLGEHAESNRAEVEERRRKMKKNLLVMEASTGERQATDMKDKVSKALSGIQVTDTRFTNGGKVVMTLITRQLKNLSVGEISSKSV